MKERLGGLGGMVLVVGVRWASRGKDAGSVDSCLLSTRLRTQQPARPADGGREGARGGGGARGGVGGPSGALRHSHYFGKASYSRERTRETRLRCRCGVTE